MDRLRFALVGTSGHANRVAAPTLREHAGAELLGAVGSRPERTHAFASQHGLHRAYETLDDLLEDGDVEAVWICSPNHLHAEQAARCAAAGKHILVDKPLATSSADAAAAVAAARGAAVRLKVGYQQLSPGTPTHLRPRSRRCRRAPRAPAHPPVLALAVLCGHGPHGPALLARLAIRERWLGHE